jgi:hypothetical protein
MLHRSAFAHRGLTPMGERLRELRQVPLTVWLMNLMLSLAMCVMLDYQWWLIEPTNPSLWCQSWLLRFRFGYLQ